MKLYDVIIIGGGQAGLSVAYFLKRSALNYLILDDKKEAGGSWLQTWESLKLFSPTEYSSLSGWAMPKSKEKYPNKTEFLNYLSNYEKRYNFPVQRQAEVIQVKKENGIFKTITNIGVFYSKTLVSATGTARNHFIPKYPSRSLFSGEQIHSLN